MNEDLQEYILKRCEKELENNERYMKLQELIAEAYKDNNIKLYSEFSLQSQSIIETTCYKAAVKDVTSFIT